MSLLACHNLNMNAMRKITVEDHLKMAMENKDNIPNGCRVVNMRGLIVYSYVVNHTVQTMGCKNWPCMLGQDSVLRIPAIHGAKTTKNLTPLVCFASLFYNQTVFQKFERTFFDQLAIDAKNVLTFEKRSLVAELKLKM